jgi:ferritin-like metal-binding protein YciE
VPVSADLDRHSDCLGRLEFRRKHLSRVLDAAIVGAAQSVEHYEIARYGTLIAWAESLGGDDVIRLLTTNLNEEKAADKTLSSVAIQMA